MDAWEELGLYVLCLPQEQVDGNLGLGYVLVGVPNAVIKHCGQKQIGKERVYLAYTPHTYGHMIFDKYVRNAHWEKRWHLQ